MTRPDSQRDRAQSGFVLLIVLWTLALLALVGTQLVAAGRSDAQLARNLHDAAVLEAATRGAVQHAIYGMLEPPERRWEADGTAHIVRSRSAVIAVRLEDEGGKVNPNLASDSLLRALLEQVGAPPATAASLAAAIADWRTPGAQPRKLGAKAAQYAAAGLDYGPPGTEFHDLDELGAVLGMTPELLARLRPHLTVYTEADPDGSTRDPVVAAVLGYPARLPLAESGARVATVIVQARGQGHTARAERVVVRINPRASRRPYDILAMEPIAASNDPPGL